MMVRLWNTTLSGRNAGGTCDIRGLTFISESNFKAFEADMAEDAARASSMAAMRAGDPHGVDAWFWGPEFDENGQNLTKK